MAIRIAIVKVQVLLALTRGFHLLTATAGGHTCSTTEQRAFGAVGQAADSRYFGPRIGTRAEVGRNHGFRNKMRDLHGGFHRAAERRAEQPVTDAADAPADTVRTGGTGEQAGGIDAGHRARADH